MVIANAEPSPANDCPDPQGKSHCRAFSRKCTGPIASTMIDLRCRCGKVVVEETTMQISWIKLIVLN